MARRRRHEDPPVEELEAVQVVPALAPLDPVGELRLGQRPGGLEDDVVVHRSGS